MSQPSDQELSRTQIVAWMRSLQDSICAGLQAREAKVSARTFHQDTWERPGGGGGRSRVLQDGELFEKAGVNFSEVHGEMDAKFAASVPGQGTSFYATGVSLVIHPKNPHVPTCHANFRYLEKGDQAWFGGGADLTPYYDVDEDREHFHAVWKKVCDAHAEVADYETFARWCDRYFYLPHRQERRGVGGIFFDDLKVAGLHPEQAAARWDFVKAAGTAFLDAYLPIVDRRMNDPFTPEQRNWQQVRRGRYVEFNLVYDRGTIFGLKTQGRIESILMSLPPKVQWLYDFKPQPGSPEAKLLERLQQPPPAPSPSDPRS